MQSFQSNSRPKWAIERPTGIWLITLGLGAYAAGLPLFRVLMEFIRYKRGMNAAFNLQEELALTFIALVVLVVCVGAWLGSKWYRYPLAILVTWYGCSSVFHSFAMASEGKVAFGDVRSLWLKIPFVLIATILAVCYLHADPDVKRFFTPYRRKVSSPKRQQTA